MYTLCVEIDKVAKSRKKSCHVRLLIRDKNTSTFHRLSIKTAQLNSRAAFMIARAIRFIFAMRLNELNNRSDWRENWVNIRHWESLPEWVPIENAALWRKSSELHGNDDEEKDEKKNPYCGDRERLSGIWKMFGNLDSLAIQLFSL